MCYSCAYFAEPSFTLEEAQAAKVEHLCRKLELRPGERLLDVGCGWGTLLFHAVEKYGVEGTGVTLSEEQARHVRAEIARRGLSGRVKVALQDYREVRGTYDKIVSVGMFEHVGKSEMPRYFRRVRDLLADGGLTVLHTIGRCGMLPTGHAEFARKYIFPGGYIPEAHEIFNAALGTKLVPIDLENLKPHYARTLDMWADRFEASLDAVRREGFDERFIRMWRFFLNASAEAFRSGVLQLYQVTFVKGRRELPRTRRHLYDTSR
jgi:cyclopropane-fatty-acyl-phospholipid synthase